ncbi:MAG TPA: hypothetical protein VJA16_17615 [Thermoanaerobaculia bacterium]
MDRAGATPPAPALADFPWAKATEPALPAGSRPAAGQPPRRWRANFYRIERPRGSPPELSCWSPTLTEPADFHRPDRFGVLELR